jgi:hypothetical protein
MGEMKLIVERFSDDGKETLSNITLVDKFVDINNDGLKDITNSGKTFNVLMTLVPDAFKIEIK